MRRPFPRGQRRESPVPTTDLDPAPTDDFHDDAAERAAARRARVAGAAAKTAAERDDRNGRRGASAQQERLSNAAAEKRAARAERHAAREAAGDGFTATFERVKETKGSFQYGECDARGNLITDYKLAKIGSVYLRKDALDGAAPDRITVTVAFD